MKQQLPQIQDCQWFLELVNDNLDLSSQSSVSLEGEGRRSLIR